MPRHLDYSRSLLQAVNKAPMLSSTAQQALVAVTADPGESLAIECAVERSCKLAGLSFEQLMQGLDELVEARLLASYEVNSTATLLRVIMTSP